MFTYKYTISFTPQSLNKHSHLIHKHTLSFILKAKILPNMARYYNNDNKVSYYEYIRQLSIPIHFFFFLCVVFLFLCFTWYLNYEPKVESFLYNLKIFLMLTPVVLLLLVHWLSSGERPWFPSMVPLPEKDSFHRAGGSPWGVAIVLVFLIYMVSHQSSFHERWFPISRR
ncbi:hypothetical protein Lser_V15G29262 [Lactuca serriola]